MPCKPQFEWSALLTIHWWKFAFFKVTGGRPMMKSSEVGFTDVVSGKRVSYYTDRFGRQWMADSGPWSWFRVRQTRRGRLISG